MDIPEGPVYTVLPPSYSEACQCPVYVTQPVTPSTPPPTYREAVFAQRMVQAERSRVTMLSQVPLGDGPTVTICPHCQQHITTIVDYKPGAAAWGMCCLLTLFGLICGICLIPFCLRSLQDAHHTCPQCNRKKRMCIC
uniref:LITAF domain-containing protein n=1 Tax=Electrophorus electricus TaxID=8005 RepID=A0A4W4FK49_ELEEL